MVSPHPSFDVDALRAEVRALQRTARRMRLATLILLPVVLGGMWQVGQKSGAVLEANAFVGVIGGAFLGDVVCHALGAGQSLLVGLTVRMGFAIGLCGLLGSISAAGPLAWLVAFLWAAARTVEFAWLYRPSEGEYWQSRLRLLSHVMFAVLILSLVARVVVGISEAERASPPRPAPVRDAL